MRFHFPTLFANGNKLLEKQQLSIMSAASVITVAVVMSSIVGLIRNRLLVSIFYENPAMEAYWVSFRLPELVFQLLVIGALSAAFIPVFTKYERISKDDAFKMASSVLNLVLLLFLFFSAIVFVFAVPFTRLITGAGFSEEQILLSANLTRLMLFAQFFFAISNFLSGTIQSYKRFIIPALSPIAYNLGIIVGTLFLSSSLGIYGPAIGVVLGAFLHFALQLPLAFKLGFRYYFALDLKHPGVREIIRLMLPRTLTLSINQLQLFTTVFFATHVGGTSLTIMSLAQQLMSFPIRFFGVPIGQAALPFLSKESNDGDWDHFKNLILRSLNQIAFFAFPASVLLLILRIPIVRLAYGAKDFPWPATLLTGRVVAILTISIGAQAIVHILIRAFYALHDTRSPFIASISSVVAYMLLSILSVYYWNGGLLGLAWAITVSTIWEMVLLFLLLSRKIPLFSVQEFFIPQFKIITASLLMAICLWVPFQIFDNIIFDTSRTINLIGLTTSVSVIGMSTYIAFAHFVGVKELYIVRHFLKVFRQWKIPLGQSPEVVETAGQSDESSV